MIVSNTTVISLINTSILTTYNITYQTIDDFYNKTTIRRYIRIVGPIILPFSTLSNRVKFATDINNVASRSLLNRSINGSSVTDIKIGPATFPTGNSFSLHWIDIADIELLFPDYNNSWSAYIKVSADYTDAFFNIILNEPLSSYTNSQKITLAGNGIGTDTTWQNQNAMFMTFENKGLNNSDDPAKTYVGIAYSSKLINGISSGSIVGRITTIGGESGGYNRYNEIDENGYIPEAGTGARIIAKITTVNNVTTIQQAVWYIRINRLVGGNNSIEVYDRNGVKLFTFLNSFTYNYSSNACLFGFYVNRGPITFNSGILFTNDTISPPSSAIFSNFDSYFI